MTWPNLSSNPHSQTYKDYCRNALIKYSPWKDTDIPRLLDPSHDHVGECEAWSRARGHRLMTIGVLAGNARAIRAYEGAGYGHYQHIMRRYL